MSQLSSLRTQAVPGCLGWLSLSLGFSGQRLPEPELLVLEGESGW